MDKIPPHNQASEEAVLGMALIDPVAASKVMTMLKPECFYFKAHGTIFKHMAKLYVTGKPVDLVSVNGSLMAADEMIDAGGSKLLLSLANSQATSANIRHYAEEVRKLHILRSLISAGGEIVEMGFHSADSDIERTLSSAEHKIFALNQSNDSKGLTHVELSAWAIYESLSKAYENDERINPRIVDTGYSDLNKMLGGGMSPGDLIVLAARPSMGKTALALNIAGEVAERSKLPVAVFSLEMSAEQCTNRMISMYSGIESQRMKSLNLNDQDWVDIAAAVERVSAMNLFIDESTVLSPGDLLSKCRRLKTEQKALGCIVIDYLQLMANALEDGKNKDVIGFVSRQLKLLAKEMDCPVIALSQLSRSVESRMDKRPIMSDLRSSGEIEQNADLILFLYRDEYYNPDTVNKNVAEVLITKNRNGPTGVIRLLFDQRITAFKNLRLDND